MELYCEIGRLVSGRPEKGTAVAAAEYLGKAYPDVKGFSPRNLRRMRAFCRAYDDVPEITAEAVDIGRTQNAAILEGCESLEERDWYNSDGKAVWLDESRIAGANPCESPPGSPPRLYGHCVLY